MTNRTCWRGGEGCGRRGRKPWIAAGKKIAGRENVTEPIIAGAGKVIPGSLNPPGAWVAAQIDTHWPDIAPECMLTFIP
ncbi:MAG: hypothetical protein ACYC45_09935 [Acidithiobacillus ferriphilus]|uniref:Uncharacterized protein n=2 Tax=Acidithiobacillus TaxID=119977 RepID=A0A257TA62_9PROT|nr:hypothetical protein [Acidithiobacillus ferriphilus]MBU2828955.1 hypothetical protein [Acidithiobacillus ferriphilus]MBU2844768.1 hypothetical protein [Acidithiobacillus ferriphilus]MEB8537493.1 hypothetical protein [Acidithiobacillus ferriphilus]OYV81551.1 MAG: hypothetical protein B7Z70_05210 [Acidithiobacillus ferrivorans]